MFYQIFLSPQVKRCATITYKHGIEELPHDCYYNLRLQSITKVHKKEIKIPIHWS